MIKIIYIHMKWRFFILYGVGGLMEADILRSHDQPNTISPWQPPYYCTLIKSKLILADKWI